MPKQKIFTLHPPIYISIYVFIYIFVVFFLHTTCLLYLADCRVLVGLFSKSISSNRNALDRCWKDSSLECTVADWINKAEPKGGREGIGGGRGMSRSLAYLLYNLLKWGWDLASASSCSIFDAYSALGGERRKNRDGRELMTSSSIIKVSRGWDTERGPPSQHPAAQL